MSDDEVSDAQHGERSRTARSGRRRGIDIVHHLVSDVASQGVHGKTRIHAQGRRKDGRIGDI